MNRELTTRPAAPDDYDFIYAVFRDGFRPHVERAWGWDEAQQAQTFRAEFAAAATEIVLLDGQPIGSLRVDDHGDHLFLDFIALLPEYRRQGLGTRLLQPLLERGRAAAVPVRLHVLAVNPACALYERLGFRVTGRDKHRLFMEALP
jgi:ribosomal protein S18 acetylase RimI-like enzyme